MKQMNVLGLLLACTLGACSSDNGDEGTTGIVLAPSDITIERIEANKVKLTWKDNSDNETGFSILMRRADNQGEITEIDKVAANVTTYTFDNILEEGNTYYLGVKAFSATATSQPVYKAYQMIAWGNIPSISVTGNVTADATCISASYQLKNATASGSEKHGLCWNTEGNPTIADNKQDGPAADAAGNVFQAVPNALLEYGKTYKVRAYVTTAVDTYYSSEYSVSIGASPADITLEWSKLAEASLPSEIELYETTSKLNGRNFHAWYAIGDLSTGNVEVRVNVPSAATTIDDQQASFGGDCYLMVNGGYFYNGRHTGIAVVNSAKSGSISAVRGSLNQSNEPEEYTSMYNVTRGAFGVDASGKPNVYWAGTDASSNIYYFNSPLPSVKGENKYAAVNSENPQAAVAWAPKYALSAGPVLLKDKKIPFDFTNTSKGSKYYLSNFEVIPDDIFGTGVKPDRTAVGYREDGKVILFICDGRIANSDGATLVELAQILKGLGCVSAINLDGGGSTGMVVNGKHLNDQTGGNRAVVSTIGFFKHK